MNRSRDTLARIDAAAIAALVASPSTIARCSWPNAGTEKPSTRHSVPGRATRISASRSAARFVRCSPRPSIPRTQRETMLTLVAVRRTTGNSASRAAASCCLESFSAPRARTSRAPSASTSNSTAAATSGPARQPRPASSAPATQRTPSPRSNRTSRRPVRGLGAAFGRAAAGSEEADAVRRPVGGEGAADDPRSGHGPPEPAVIGLATVVAHHEPMPGRNPDRRRQVAPAAKVPLAGRADVRVLLAPAVADHVAVDDLDRVARPRDDALDEVHAVAPRRRPVAGLVLAEARVAAGVRLVADRRVEDDHLAHVGRAEAVADPVDQHPLADLERRNHRLAGDAIRLDQEGLDAERQAERDDDDDDELDQRAARRLLLLPHARSSAAGSASAVEPASAVSAALASAGAASAGAPPPPPPPGPRGPPPPA